MKRLRCRKSDDILSRWRRLWLSRWRWLWLWRWLSRWPYFLQEHCARARAPLMTAMEKFTRRAGPAERGSVTVISAAIVAVCLLMAVALAGLAGVQTARGRAQTAADLAALAAAHSLASFEADPCRQAAGVAAANGAAVSSCGIVGRDVIVETRVPVAGPLSPARLTASAAARAGPDLP